MGKPILIDLFCGAGGESSGLMQAFQSHDMACEMYAVNHWELAIETHGLNHPDACHYVEDVFKGTAKKHIKDRRVALLWASPECTHFSVAKGGRPCSAQSRAGANSVLEWCRDLTVDRVILENVSEWRSWGELDDKGRPIPERKGKLFEEWVGNMRKLGYDLDWRVLCAADFGAPTSRERLFVQAVRRKSGKKIVWPQPTHSRENWTPASSVIDWSDLGTPLHERKRPLCENTLRRIEMGIRKHWGEWAEPFICVLRGTSVRAMDNSSRSIHQPLPTITAGGQHLSLVVPIDNGSTKGGARPPEEPLTTITTKQRHGVLSALVMGQHSGSRAKPADQHPVPTLTTVARVQLINPLLVNYYGTGICHGVDEPVPTVTTKQRFGMIAPTPELALAYRMLNERELALATGFPADYKFAGNKTQTVKQIGNAVPPAFAFHQTKHYIKEMIA